MKIEFAKTWNKSTQPRKQRKYRYNAPLHVKQKFVKVHLSKDLRTKYGKRAAGLRKGDKVLISRGQFKKKTGKVERIDVKKTKVYITGIEIIKREGSKSLIPIDPTNLIIQELNLEDKKRIKKIQMKLSVKEINSNKPKSEAKKNR
ncbi:MAG: 50S ribosomal protein L24 [Candidatus Woesearchaeota archaeon]